MVKPLLLLLVLLASGCFEDRYHCASDSQCDLGEGGRCEVDQYCTLNDTHCDTLRSYAAHAGPLSGECFDDRIAPLNACAGGQPPAMPDPGCFAEVCGKLKACCEVGWSDACVQIAQETASCALACDTRIALTATRGTVTERWLVRWANRQWQSIDPRNDLDPVAWVGPAPGTTEPRLAGGTPSELVIGETHLEVPSGRTYQSITSIGFDRDRRDTIAATYSGPEGNRLEIWKLDTLTAREQSVPGTVALTWGEADRNTYPDAIVRNGQASFSFLYNVQDDQFQHRLLNQTAANIAGGPTPGAPQLRSFDWADINSDGKLDLIMFGAEVRMHTTELGLGDGAAHEIDCDPPNPSRPCSTEVNEPNLEAASFAGCAVPTTAGPHLVISMFPGRDVFRVQPSGTVSNLPFPGAGCNCAKSCNNMCPGPNCSCTYNCNTCVPVLAFVSRDLDGDHLLDLIAIDARLQLYVALASTDFSWSAPMPIPTTFTNTFVSIDVSVTGAPTL